ncbi:MAG: hypothetical protein WC668_00875 [Patescibacteria group bacterium]|jgi:hypothetical protein
MPDTSAASNIESNDKRSGYRVSTQNWDGFNRRGFRTIAREVLLPIVQKDIVISVPRQTEDFSNNGKFNIKILSSPQGLPKTNMPKEIFGHRVFYDLNDSYTATGLGEAIIDESTGYAVAELFPDNLYIHYDICHSDELYELKIFRLLLKKVAAFLQLLPAEMAQRRKQQQEKILIANRERYAALLSSLINSGSRAADAERITEMEEKIRDQRIALTQALFELAAAKRKQADSIGSKGQTEILAEFERLRSMSKVRDVAVSDDGTISVTTNVLYCRNKATGLLYEIGAFRLDIRLKLVGDYSEPEDYLSFTNITRTIGGYLSDHSHHPHIFKPKDFCLGNAEEIVPDLLSNLEIRALVGVMIQFIESVNPRDDAGVGIFLWPLAPLEMQSPEAQDRLKDLWSQEDNPFKNVDAPLRTFVRTAQIMPKGYDIAFDCGWRKWHLNGALAYTREIATWLGVDEAWAYVIMANYFSVASSQIT